MNKSIKNKFKILKNIAADPDKKAEFRNVLFAKIGRQETALQTNPTNMPAISLLEFALGRLKSTPIFAMLLIFFVFSASVGAAFASQDALPGELLYPVKIAAEKIELAATKDEAKKTSLHLEFATKRLSETEQIIETGGAEARIDNLLSNYQKELNESQKILEKTGAERPEIAIIIDQKTEAGKKSMAIISEKIQRKIKEGKLSGKYKDILEEAGEHAEKVNDAANILIFSTVSSDLSPRQEEIEHEIERKPKDDIYNETLKNSTSTEKLKLAPRSSVFSKKSNEKIKTAKEKISETEKHIAELKKEGYATDIAEKKIEEAKSLLEQSESLANEQGYQKSLLQSIQARQTAEEAKKLSKKSKHREEKRRNEESENDKQTKIEEDEKNDDEDDK